MGGGTGTFAVVSALKKLNWDISTVIAVSDSGGSTGRIRDEFGFQPVGDLRQSLAALADIQGQPWIQKILLYRFEKGEGLKGHNLGNLILTALQDMTGSTTKSLEIAKKIFNLGGTVIPVTEKFVDLEITYSDGSTVVGEHTLDEDVENPISIDSVKLIPECSINPKAKKALEEADIIIIGPGDFYASLMATLVLPGMKTIFNGSVLVCCIMTRLTQTHNMTANDHLSKIEEALGREVSAVITNSEPIPKEAAQIYASAHEFPVIDNLKSEKKVVRTPLINDSLEYKKKYDTSYRSLLRHDHEKLAQTLKEIAQS